MIKIDYKCLTMWLTANKNLYIQAKMEQKCQAHNLKVVGSNPAPTTNYINKINNLDVSSKSSVFGFFLRLKPDNHHRVINKVIVRQA